ncbi:hypothetical protein Bbelb_011250 [Branchiostoma belcheri]|nr:hypothetical protein Bbelb_011250 [Branchiostoma belcheri]
MPLSFANKVAVSTAWARAPAPQVSAQPDQDSTKEKSLVAAISDEEGEDGDEDKEREEDLESVDYASSDEESIFRPHKDSSDVEENAPMVSKSEKVVGARPKATVSAPTADPKPAQGKESPKPALAKESGMEMEVAQGGGELADSQTDMFKDSAEEPASTGSLILAGLPEDGANKFPDSGKLTEPGTSLGLELPLSENLVIDQFTSTSSGEESNSGKRMKGRNSKTSRKWSLRGSKVDTEGRVVSVLISDGESTYNAVNVYAPGTSGERKTFFASLHQYMFPNAELVVVGDFNCVLDPGKDRTSASVFVPGSGAQDVKELSALVSDQFG